MYHVMKTYVHTGDELFDWCCNITEKANSLENAALFRMRNVITAVRKEPAVWTQNEQRVMDEVTSSAILHHKQIPDKDHFFLSYTLLDKVFRDTDSPDFFADGLPRQSAQQAIKRVRHRMKGFSRLSADTTCIRKNLQVNRVSRIIIRAAADVLPYSRMKAASCIMTPADGL